MNPKINGVGGSPPRIDSGKGASAVQPGSGSQGATSVGRGDEVSFTDSAQLLMRLEQALEELPVIDRARVESIKAAIADGQYSIDAERVAAEVLRMELDLNSL